MDVGELHRTRTASEGHPDGSRDTTETYLRDITRTDTYVSDVSDTRDEREKTPHWPGAN